MGNVASAATGAPLHDEHVNDGYGPLTPVPRPQVWASNPILHRGSPARWLSPRVVRRFPPYPLRTLLLKSAIQAGDAKCVRCPRNIAESGCFHALQHFLGSRKPLHGFWQVSVRAFNSRN